MKTKLLSWLLTLSLLITMLPTAAFAADGTSENTYEVSTAEELSTELTNIAASADTEATIVLKADITLSNDVGSGYITSFGATDKHITVKSEGEMKKLSFPSYGVLTGDCTFDNVYVIGRRLFCNGYRTIFTENGKIYLSETLYGGGYKKTVASTYVVIAASGSINPSSSSGLHDVIGGSYQGSVEGDTYLEITGDIKMQGGNHLNPGCMKGDGTSSDGAGVSNVYVGGNATLIYDNKSSTASPAIEGTYGCEMRGNVTLDVRAGCVAGIVGTEEPVDKSIIRGNLHIIAGNPAYENTDRILRLGSNWPIVGAGNSFATEPGAVGNYAINGNIVIDTYENVWAWDKGTTPDSYDLPEIYGALRGNVGGNITINAHGSHVQNIFGASDSVVQGSVTVNATDVELKNSYYDTEYDEGYIFGLWQRVDPATANGPVTVTVNGGDVGLVMATDQETVPAGSSINVTGKPKIRSGIRGTQASSYSTEWKGKVLAVGGELKNTFCIGVDSRFYPSPYVGDLEDLRTVKALQETIQRFQTLLEVHPQVVVCDLHPKYNSTVVAEELGYPIVKMQHHYAHILSCMVENDCQEPVIGVAFDGTGYGTDGTIWGGEILLADYEDFTRFGNITPFLQIGGDVSAKEGWRIAVSMIYGYTKDRELAGEIMKKLDLCSEKESKVQFAMADRKLNAVLSTSVGRLFDAVSAILGIRHKSSFEGEASMALEFAAEAYEQKDHEQKQNEKIDPLVYEEDGHVILNTQLLVQRIVEAKLQGADSSRLAYWFHEILAEQITAVCVEARNVSGRQKAVLSGGVFQNRLLLRLTEERLTEEGFEVLRHRMVPPNDGGIAVGQAAYGMAQLFRAMHMGSE